jgi:archaemetzincin
VILKEILGKRIPADALVYVGITNEDLWVGKLNYLFGLGSFKDPTAVLSLCRFFPEFSRNERVAGDDVQALRRAMKILNHETSHVFGLRHCIFYHCSMNGCNSLSELDAAPIFLCPVCHRKLRGLLGWDAGKRYDELSSFYQQHGLEAEAGWASKRLERWRTVEAREHAARGGDDE